MVTTLIFPNNQAKQARTHTTTPHNLIRLYPLAYTPWVALCVADIMTEAIVKIGLLDPPQRMRETAWKFDCYSVLLQVRCGGGGGGV